jgi:Tfp pilus assembly pilus retraction ATPase PilT
MTENFSLIRGMPGSGKTTTIVGLIRNIPYRYNLKLIDYVHHLPVNLHYSNSELVIYFCQTM